MALRNITNALKAVAGDATKIAALERDVLGFLPSATKKEFLDVSTQIAEAKAFTQPVWNSVQTQYLQRYDEFTAEDVVAFWHIIASSPLDIYTEVDEKLWDSLVYLGKKESEKHAQADPAFEEKMDTVIQGILAQTFGSVLPMIKDGEDIFTDTTSGVEILTRERQPEDIENRFEEILGIRDIEIDNYNPALEKIFTQHDLEEDEQIELWESIINPKTETKLVSAGDVKKVADSVPSKKQ